MSEVLNTAEIAPPMPAVERHADAGIEVRLRPSGRAFVCKPGETILKAGLSAGLALPYECASGTCSTCRARLLEGTVQSLWPDAPGLTERDRKKGDRILCCQSLPLTSCRIQLEFGAAGVMPVPRTWHGVVEESVALTHNVVRLRLRFPDAPDFLAGQFMLFELPGVGRRAYSMSNAPDASGHLDFIIKRKPDGRGSDFLFGMVAEGDTLSLEGPYGHAYLRAASERPIVGVAGGSGLGPVWSVVQAALYGGCKQPVHLFFGVNDGADLFYADEFAALARRFPQLHVERVVMRLQGDDPADCTVGTACEVMLNHLGDANECDLYMAGPPAMIDAALRDTVLARKANAEHVFFDRFY